MDGLRGTAMNAELVDIERPHALNGKVRVKVENQHGPRAHRGRVRAAVLVGMEKVQKGMLHPGLQLTETGAKETGRNHG